MRLIALVFAILAAVPQALKWMVYGFARMSDCTLPATVCEIGGNDQSEILNMIWGPNWFTTTGLWIGGIGLVVCIIVIKIMGFIDDRKASAAMTRADRQDGVGGRMGQGTPGQPRSGDDYGRMPRPPAFDKYGRPRQ